MSAFPKIQNQLIRTVVRFQRTSLTIKGISAVSLIFLAGSCYDNPDPSVEPLLDYRFYYANTNAAAVGGDYLADSIYVQVHNLINPSEASGFKVEFEVKSGGGSVDQQQVVTNSRGRAATRWKLGTESFKQILTARIYGPDKRFLPGVSMIAYGILPHSWNDVDLSPLSQLSDMVADTDNQLSWMISANKIYQRGTNFLDWTGLDNTGITNPREIEIDKNGVLYVGTWQGELYKSTDHGLTWLKCTNPIPDRPYYFYFWITGDGDLWASVHDRGLWHSSDGGTTWINPGTDQDVLNGAFRLKNGWLLSLKGTPQTIKKSEDNGKTWIPVPTPAYPYCFYVTGNDEIIVCTQGGSVKIYKSTDLGNSFQQVHSVPVTFGTGSFQTYFHRYGSWYYFAVPGYGVLKTQNFNEFETMLNEPYINGLYIDHTGSLAAKGTLEKQGYMFYYNNE